MNEFLDVNPDDLKTALANNSSTLTDEEQQLAKNSKYRSLVVEDIRAQRKQENQLLAAEQQKQADADYRNNLFPKFDTETERPIATIKKEEEQLRQETASQQFSEGVAEYGQALGPDYQQLITNQVARERVGRTFDLLAAENRTPEQWKELFDIAKITGAKPSFILRATGEDQAKINQLVKERSFKLADLDTPIVFDIFTDKRIHALASDSIQNMQVVEDRLSRQRLVTEQAKQARIQSNNLYDNFRYGQLQLETLLQAVSFWGMDKLDADPQRQSRRDWQLLSLAQQAEESPHDLRLGKFIEEYDNNGLGAALYYGLSNPTIGSSILAQALPSIGAGGPFGKGVTSIGGRLAQGRIANLAVREWAVKAGNVGGVGFFSTASMGYPVSLVQGFEKTGDIKQALSRAKTQTSIDSAFGFLSGTLPAPAMLTNRFSGRLGNILYVGTESTAQGIGSAGGAYYSAKAVGDEITGGEIFANFALGYITAPLDLSVASLSNGKNFDFTTRSNLETTRAVADEIKNSPIASRDPDTAKQVIARIKEQSDSPVQDVYLPVEEFNRYFQEQGIDPIALADQVTGKQGALEEALATGADLQIPLENYLVDIAARGHDAVFANELRTAPDAMNARELAEFDNTIKERAEDITSQINEAVQKGAKTLQDNRVYNDVYGQLVGINRDKATAEKEALIYGSLFNTLAERLNIDPMELYNRYSLQIKRNLPDILTQARNSDNLDLLINRLRSGDIPSETSARGKTLFQRIKELGGIRDEGGELANRDIDKGKKGKARITNNKTGKSLDDIASQLAREGYLFDQETNLADIAEMDKRYTGVDLVNILLDKIDAESRGELQYSPLTMNDDLFSIRQQLTELSDLVDRQGLDLNNLTNQQVKDLLLNDSQRYNQEDTKLSAIHNLDQSNLAYADNLGGLAVPSIGIVTRDKGAVAGFGDVTLIGTRNLADPRQVPAYSSDAYSPRFPREEFEPIKNAKRLESIVSDIEPEAIRTGDDRVVGSTWDYLQSGDFRENVFRWENSPAIKSLFLKEQGVEVKPAYKEPTFQTGLNRNEITKASKLNDDLSKIIEVDEYFSNNAEAFVNEKIKPLIEKSLDRRYSDRPELLSKFKEKLIKEDAYSLLQKIRGDIKKLDNLIGNKEIDTEATVKRIDSKLNKQKADFEQWVNNKLRAIYGEPFVKLGNKKVPFNLDNVVKAMTRGSVKGAEQTMGFGTGKAKAQTSTKFNSLKQMREAAKRYIESPAEYEKAVAEAEKVQDQYREVLSKFSKMTNIFDAFDDATQAMADIATRGNYSETAIKSILEKNYFDTAKLEQAIKSGEVKDFYKLAENAARSLLETPVPYFESKPQRAVGLDEFAGAVIPDNASKQTIDILKKNNIPYVKYKKGEAGSRENTVRQFTEQLSNKGLDTLFQKQNDQVRGFIDIAKDGSVRINLTENANLSTFLHETGHFFLNVIGDIEKVPQAGADVKEMASVIKKWLKADDLNSLTVAQHEKFARGFEAYLFEGKAPTIELQGAFSRFKAWLTQVYKIIKNLNVKLNDDVRRVFDRMLATDDAIEVAKAPYNELFTTAEQMGVTPEEFAVYRETAEKASVEAKDKLLSDSLKEIKRETESWWNDEKAKLKEQVTQEVNNQPVYRVQDYLRKGIQTDGVQGEPVKLNRDVLIQRYGKGIVKDLKGLTAKEGVNPESVSMMWGYSSSDEMVKALQSAPDRNALINAETDVRMREIYGDILNDGTMSAKAIHAFEDNANRAKVIRAELAAIEKLRKAAEQVSTIRERNDRAASRDALDAIPSNTLLRDVAQRTIGDTKLMNINPNLYLQASRKASREAVAYARNKDWYNVSLSKQKELINHFLYLEASKARQTEAKIFNYFNKFDKKATRERIGKAEGGHLEQIDALLADYEFKRVSNRAIARRKSLASYVAEQQAQGNIVAIDQAIIDNANVVNYRELTYEQLQALRDAVKNIETIASLKNKLISAQGKRDLQETKDALISQLNSTVKEAARVKPLSKSSRTNTEVFKDMGSKIDASLIRMEHLISNLDRGDVDGIFHQVFWNPLADAQANEKAMFKADMLDIMQKADVLEGLNDTHYINSLGRSFATRELIMIALNTGNESNKAKLLKGGIDGLQLQPAQLADILAPLTKDKWDFVQEVWNKFDNRWPDIAAMYKRLSGVEPPAIEATPINTQYGEYKGGYFPIIYDRSRQNAPDAFLGGELFNGDFEGALPSNGFTNARNDNVTGPLKLEIESISQHMMMQIHDLTHREALQNAYRLAKDRDIRNALIKKLGSEQADLFINWLKNIANDANPAGGGVGSRLINAVRNNTSVVGLGFSTTTMLAQIGGVVPVIRYAGAKDFAGGLIQLMQHPLDTPRFIMENSPAMRARWDTTQSRIEASFDRLKGKNEFFRQKERVVRFAFDLLNYIDRYVTGAGWMAAYNRAIREGKSTEVAVRAGDAVVRKSQGGFGAMDRAAIQYGDDGKVMAMFTMFYTPFSAFYNQGRDLHFEVRNGITSKSKAAAIILATAFFQGVIGDLLTGQGPDDDENTLAWMGKSTLGFGTSGFPIVRDVVSAWTGGRVYSLSPLAQTINKVTSLPTTVKGLAEGKEGKGKQVIEAGGLVLGVPVKPLTRQGDAFYQMATGEYDPKDAGGFVKALIYGVRKKDKE